MIRAVTVRRLSSASGGFALGEKTMGAQSRYEASKVEYSVRARCYGSCGVDGRLDDENNR